jgi:endonuclease III
MGTRRLPSFAAIISALRKTYGKPKPPTITDPFGLILFENVAYLGSDERREAAFAALKSRIGIRPRDIAAASDAALLKITKFAGIMPEANARKLRRCADIALALSGGELRPLIRGPLADARKALKRFPGIGEPGVDRILLFARVAAALALDSNALRVVTRLGFAEEQTDYARTYQSARRALAPHAPKGYAALIEASQLLRQHGRELCKRTDPRCPLCPLTATCAFYGRMNSTASSSNGFGRPAGKSRRP